MFKAGACTADIGTVNVPNLRAQFGELAPKNMTVRLKGVGLGRKSVRTGLDIGSSAVRAAEVAISSSGNELRRFAQIGLPMGAVVEGEVRDEAVVSEAIRRLWAEGGLSQKEVVLGIGSQRAMVRQLEMPEMTEAELRSALRYEIGELLPIPVEEAVFDFAVLGPGRPKADGGGTTQVLVVVAQRDIVWDSINVVRRAGLRVRAVDSSPLALLRVVPLSEENQDLEAVVSIGSHLVVVAVREGSTPRFLRTVSISGTGAGVNQPARAGVAAEAATRPSSSPTAGAGAKARLYRRGSPGLAGVLFFARTGRAAVLHMAHRRWVLDPGCRRAYRGRCRRASEHRRRGGPVQCRRSRPER